VQGKVKQIDEDEAKKQFFDAAMGEMERQGLDHKGSTQPRYPHALQPTMCVLDDMCRAVVESIEGAVLITYIYMCAGHAILPALFACASCMYVLHLRIAV
jgi:hypothetical protein